jgi:D-serine deaminase-like pyridoxal phosphate-dependent protein
MWNKPTFVIDISKVQGNIRKMQQKAVESRVMFRPHFKTHQNIRIGELFRKKGVSSITVSSVTMAKFFATNGWEDITIAFPVNLNEIIEINKLASEITLNILVESSYSAKFLADQIKSEAGIFIKIDTGYHRTGLQSGKLHEISEIVKAIKKSGKLSFKGFLAHAGHTYTASSKDEIERIYHTSINQLSLLKKAFINEFPKLIISYGDTPSCSIVNDLSALDEIRPGNFVFYDVMQLQTGSCTLDEIACTVVCPVVAVHPKRNEVVIYGGAVHLSKEFLVDKNMVKIYGLIVKSPEKGQGEPISGAYVKSLSQEHGLVYIPSLTQLNLNPGDWIGILPMHSCLTANLLKEDTVFVS